MISTDHRAKLITYYIYSMLYHYLCYWHVLCDREVRMQLFKQNKTETIMLKSKLILSTVIVLLSVTHLVAEPISTNYTAQPEPVHGMQFLKAQTQFPAYDQNIRNDGYVLLNFHVDKVGNISNIKVAQSGGSRFDAAAIAAVEKTDWNPAMQNGTAIPVTFQLPFEFHAK